MQNTESLKNNKLILGVDPGIRHTGWGVVSYHNYKIEHIAHGSISPPNKNEDSVRLNFIAKELNKIIINFKPSFAAIEKIFVNVNSNSILQLGMARGVAMQVIQAANLPITELAARLVKKSITGSGSADKIQVKFMIERLLKTSIKGYDASDALAVSITGLNYSYKGNIPGGNVSISKLDQAIERALIQGN